MARYHTNLATDFYVLSCLHRVRLDAHLTLGNRKGVDIVVLRDDGDAVTVEAKGLAGKYEWPAGNLGSQHPEHRFVVLISFEGQIAHGDIPSSRAWIVPFPDIDPCVRHYRTRTNVACSTILRDGTEYENAWSLIAGREAHTDDG